MKNSLSILALIATALPLVAQAPKPTKPNEPMAKEFSVGRAAEFIDGVSLSWTRERKCMTCHTNVPYMMARPLIEGGDPKPLQEIRIFLENNVKSWANAKPKSDYDVVATAFALAANDAVTTKKLHPATKAALDKTWTIQLKDGSWKWPDCNWPPLEHDQFYGVAYMAVAVAIAPEDYASTPAAKKGMQAIRAYLKANPTTELHHRATLLWASTKIEDLLTEEEKKSIVAELLKLQLPDGGWSLPALGPYGDRLDGTTNPMNVSDGYGTGFVTYVLLQSGLKADHAAIQKSVKWMQSNQRESGRWFTRSPKADRAHYITNAGSSFCVLALNAAGVKLKAE